MPSIIDDLKRAFSAGNIPSEKDFTTLIDLASRPNSLLGINEQGEAEAILNGLIVANNQLAISLAKDSGLNLVDNKLAVKAGAGININDTDGIFLKAESGSGIKIDKGIISVDPWPGVVLDDEKHLKANLGKGLKLVDNAVNLDLSDGLVVDDASKKLAVKVLKDGAKDNTSGLVLGKDGLKINISPDGNNIEIDKTTGSLKLTQEALTTLKEGSRSKFISALQTAQEASAKLTPPALDENDPVTLTIDGQGNQEEWQGPLERLINKANNFGQNEVVRARESLEEQIKIFIKTQDPRPTNNNIRMNFSPMDGTLSPVLRWGKEKDEYFNISATFIFNSNKKIVRDVNPDDFEHVITTSNFPKGGFYAFIGKLDKPGQEGKDDKEGHEITPNAIMVHISEKLVYAVGFWDLSTDNLEWYKFETDPSTNIITRKVEELKITPLIFRIKVNDDNRTLAISGGDGSQSAFFPNEHENYIKIDKDGKLTPVAWNDKVRVTASQPASRTKNGTNTVNIDITIEPLENVPFKERTVIHKYGDIAKNEKYNFEVLGGNPDVACTFSLEKSSDEHITFDYSKKPYSYRFSAPGKATLIAKQPPSSLYQSNEGKVISIIINGEFDKPKLKESYLFEFFGANDYYLFIFEKPSYGNIFLNLEKSVFKYYETKFTGLLETRQREIGGDIYLYCKFENEQNIGTSYYLGTYCFFNSYVQDNFEEINSVIIPCIAETHNPSKDIPGWPEK